MSDAAWIALVLGLLVLGGILLILVRSAGSIEAEPEPQDWPGTTAAQEWDQKADSARDDFGLKAVQDTAKAWAASIAALLGILSTVAFVKGPDALVKDVGGWEADLAAWLILAAAAVAAVAVLLAVLAEQGVPKWTENLTGWKYRSLTRQRAERAAGQIQASRYLVLAALCLMVFATGTAWLTALTGEEKSSAQHAVVLKPSGPVCGELQGGGGALSLKVGAGTQPINEASQITLVDSCPK